MSKTLDMEGVAVILAILLGFAIFTVVGACSYSAFGEERQPLEFDEEAIRDVLISHDIGLSDILAPMAGAVLEEPGEELEEAVVEDEYYEEYYGEYYEEPTGGYSGSGDGFKQQGVRSGVDSDTETWYSSNQAYHYRTAEWSVDDEGYYRDSDGYYVVASDDYEQGSVVNTSKGEAKVYDSGTASGNIDMYVAW